MKGQELEILLVSTDRAGSPTRYVIWMTGLLVGGVMRKVRYVRDRQLDDKLKWVSVFQEIYGNPYCEICQKPLSWYSPGDAKRSVHWDHRKGEYYSELPSQWITRHRPTDGNIKKFLTFDLGILCRQCNFYLGSDPQKRIEKAQNMVFYLAGKTPHEIARRGKVGHPVPRRRLKRLIDKKVYKKSGKEEDPFEVGPDGKKKYTHPDCPKPRKK